MSHSTDLLSVRRDPEQTGAGWLAVAFVSTLLASVCCVLPLVLVLLGISGAWLARVPHWQPLSPALSGLSWIALAFAGWQLYRQPDCADGETCAPSPWRKRLRWAYPAVCLLAAVPVLLTVFAERFYGA
ncbi:hypothetical protein BH09PSE6_BH09PSE6_28540 [soil metagenome]